MRMHVPARGRGASGRRAALLLLGLALVPALASVGCGKSRVLPDAGDGISLADGDAAPGDGVGGGDTPRPPPTDTPNPPPPTDTTGGTDTPAPQCATPLDCAAVPWVAPCPGDWQCDAGVCVPVCAPQCDAASACALLPWGDACPGFWTCTGGYCDGQCNPAGCGDGVCDGPGGESASSCAADCNAPCSAGVDCGGYAWTLTCGGHWDCPAGSCAPVCDATACGDGACAAGETAMSCPLDCASPCREPSDCLDRPWPVRCGGRWACLAGLCTPSCEFVACGDGTCDVLGGESTVSCARDCAPPCAQAGDCAGLPWGAQCQGTWQCQSGRCQPQCKAPGCGDGVCTAAAGEDGGSCPGDCHPGCTTDAAGCLTLPWGHDCPGHFACVGARCAAVCDSAACGDGVCTAAVGESLQSCPADCMPQCTGPEGCVMLNWPLFCTGHWACEDAGCVPLCEFDDCGDGTCAGAAGESAGSCPRDCGARCTAPSDCLLLPWTESCGGRWDCPSGLGCTPNCTDGSCGNGRCEAALGESVASCASDCGALCETPADCLPQAWRVACPGHWECTASRCAAHCELDACGDGNCDAAAGETAASCPPDCAAPCTGAADCAGNLWYAGCDGAWQCRDGECRASCDAAHCGDGLCDEPAGETPAACPADCRIPCPAGLGDCLGEPWRLPCTGRWACPTGDCEAVCDVVGCGDGICQSDAGEAPLSCPADCTANCVWTPDCIGLPWPLECGGAWSCDLGYCTPHCTPAACGDGVCDTAYGETSASCPADCAVACGGPRECLALPWSLWCAGHWACTASLCAAVCDAQACGDGTCNPDEGETGASCAADCLVRCQVVEDCLPATWTADCPGHWECRAPECAPVCDEAGCGDGRCDAPGGESPAACPTDCAAPPPLPEDRPDGRRARRRAVPRPRRTCP